MGRADSHAFDDFGVDRVLGGERHANRGAGHRLAQRWTDQFSANRRAG
jgi:hypothetical protein